MPTETLADSLQKKDYVKVQIPHLIRNTPRWARIRIHAVYQTVAVRGGLWSQESSGTSTILAPDLALPAFGRPTGQGGVLSPMPSPQRVRTRVPIRNMIQRTEDPVDGGDPTFHDVFDRLSPSPAGSRDKWKRKATSW